MTVRLLAFFLSASACWAQPADLLLHNGRVWTANAKQPWAQSVAVKDGKIAAVGSDRELAKWRGPKTEVIDAAARLVVPGFNDAHIHFLGGSLGLAEVDLTGVCTIPEIQKKIKVWADSNPNAPWITGGGWEYTCFPNGLPRKEDLDAAVADRPAFIRAYDGHTSWVNSKALAAAGISRDTKYDGFGGIVFHPQTGEPTGALKEGASSLVSRLLPKPTAADKLAALQSGLQLAASLGLTSIQNASGSRDDITLYEELLKQGKLTARVSVAPSIGRTRCAAIDDLRGKYSGPMLRVAAVKFMLDGVVESHTAAMLEPYSDAPGEKGTPAWKAEDYIREVQDCDARGWQIYTHAIGDSAIRIALDAYKDNKTGRPRIEHIEVIAPEDIPRFGKQDVIASMMPIHADPGTVAVWSRAVGPQRVPYAFNWRAIQSAGGRLVFSSDWPASISVDPIRGLHNAVNRQTVDGKPPGGWLPEQRVTLETALRGYTSEAAYASFEETRKGSIEPGKAADFVVLTKDLFRIPPADIHTAKAAITVFDGKVIYRRPR